jgi:hypothetical protein
MGFVSDEVKLVGDEDKGCGGEAVEAVIQNATKNILLF